MTPSFLTLRSSDLASDFLLGTPAADAHVFLECTDVDARGFHGTLPRPFIAAPVAALHPAPRRVHPRHQAHRVRANRQNRFSGRSEEHTSELQSLMRNSYAVFCLKKKTKKYLDKPGFTQHYLQSK